MTISMEIRLTDSELFQSWFAFTLETENFHEKKNSFPRLLSEHKLVVISF
jgi:hypothetical protein